MTEQRRYKCDACNKECDTHVITETEPCEFWGAKTYERMRYVVSTCCDEAAIIELGEPDEQD